MASNPLDRGVIRQYLLGRLDDQEQLESEVSEAILYNDDQAAIVETVEDELIEEYLDGTLDAHDRKAIEEYFLQSSERKQQLRFMNALRTYFATRRSSSDRAKQNLGSLGTPASDRDMADAVPYWRSHLRSYLEIATLVLLVAGSLIYVSSIRRNQAALQVQLAQEKEHSLMIAQATPPAGSLASLTLVEDRHRATGSLPVVRLGPSARRVIVEIALPPGTVAAPYDVKLAPGAGTAAVWSATLLPLLSSSLDARLMFDVPMSALKSGKYTFVVSSTPPRPVWSRSYDFQATVTE